MKVNQPASVSQQDAVGIAQAPGVAPAAASMVEEATSHFSVAHIPLHFLGAPSEPMDESASSPAASNSHSIPHASSALPPFSQIHDDPIGIIARCLPQKDQLQFASLNRALKGVVERSIETLIFPTDDAVSLLKSVQRLPNLKSLFVNGWVRAPLALGMSALPKLEEFGCSFLMLDVMQTLLDHHPRLDTVKIGIVKGAEAPMAPWTSHPSLTRLHIGDVTTAEGIVAVSRNDQLAELRMGISRWTAPYVAPFAHMRSLNALTLFDRPSRFGERIDIPLAAMKALCQKLLDRLEFIGFEMNEACVSVAATAPAKTLCFVGQGSPIFWKHQIDILLANSHVATLSIKRCYIDDGQMARLAASPTIRKLILPAPGPHDESIDNVQAAWVGAGKSPVDLTFLDAKGASAGYPQLHGEW